MKTDATHMTDATDATSATPARAAAPITARALAVEGAFVFTPQVHRDERGIFTSPLQGEEFARTVGHPLPVVQTNHNRSARGVLRGVHFTTTPPGQAKYVHCAAGRAQDFVVDLRLGSPTFGAWDTVAMDTVSFRSIYLPVGVGHAFVALEDDTVMSYLVSSPYRPGLEQSLDPFDAELALPWPKELALTLSERDTHAVSLAEARRRGMLPRYEDCLKVTAGYA
ncbi:dTDP-4-dehydrorhamnose 3,5-epimerase [Streptomyces spiroverticillatus]|uniref:dTDP-4-dehydrorhamnose 3,5-epimerase n=1 Tax=Streptomyces finlayi TaxID=67296 RepID=A0A918X534_9ACTN|nr:dTDP-4-dehydrorhamnose 3,5-epimerase family protein [Streptomyces finlayi]GHA35883.1 dTDP-4-dehydrorhamnose 3,5-epimerase [Streptomyces spiroverticillatus]GHD12558.1 dTDP-4-dehydrorhamnose 3,5-epimerase [Streptomyces finlayi]